jgi:hypothetical protein
MSPATRRLVAFLEQAGRHDQGTRRVVAALCRNADRIAGELEHLTNLVDALGPSEAAARRVVGRRGGLRR